MGKFDYFRLCTIVLLYLAVYVTIFSYAHYYAPLSSIMEYCMEVDFHGALIGEGNE